MKAYPLIYSRTKNFDFVPDFLVRPADLEVAEALKYISDAMYEIDFVDSVRYTAFTTEKYCICGGISAISRNLFEIVQQTGKAVVPDEVSESVQQFLKDCKGRKVACYIGIAIPRSELRHGVIPDLSLEQYWHIYMEYIRHQWDSVTETASEKIAFPPLEIDETTYMTGSKPQMTEIGGRSVIRHSAFLSGQKQILDYVFNEICSGKRESFIAEIEKKALWDKTVFHTAVVSDVLFPALQAAPSAKPAQSTSRLRQTDDSLQIKRAPQPGPSPIQSPLFGQKKKDSPSSLGILLIAAAIILLVIIIVLIAHR